MTFGPDPSESDSESDRDAKAAAMEAEHARNFCACWGDLPLLLQNEPEHGMNHAPLPRRTHACDGGNSAP